MGIWFCLGLFGWMLGVFLVGYFKKDVGQAILVYLPRKSLCREELAAKLLLTDALG